MRKEREKMKKILNLLMVSLLFLLLGKVGFSGDLEESKYEKNFIISKTRIINIPKSTSGTIFYKLPKGSYRIEIISINKNSTMHLDDALVDTVYKTEDEIIKNAVVPYFISAGHYKFKVKSLNSKTMYKQGFKTTVTSGKLLIKIIKIK